MLALGARIGLIATSHRFFDEPYAQGRQWIERAGMQVVEVGPTTPHRYFAGTDEQRLQALVDAFQRPDLDAVWAIRGGSGVSRLLPSIPWPALRPIPLIGFSDLTPLLDKLSQNGHTAIHGPVVHSLARTDAASLAHLQRLLTGTVTDPLEGHVLIPGQARGALVGGNLCMLASACGTPAQLNADGCILIIEEIGEQPYKIDRMLQQLSQSGVLAGVTGIGLGQFTRCAPPSDAAWTLRDVFVEHFSDLGVPVLADLPIGHGPQNRAFPIRAAAEIRDGRLSWHRPSV